MPPIVRKAFIYLTRDDRDLLLLAHPDHPEAGLQVPAGTMKAGEEPEAAAARELAEETGLTGFRITRLLGEHLYDFSPFGRRECHRRFFHHAVLTGPAPERWRHAERDAGPEPIALELFWWNLRTGDPDLMAGHGEMIHRLRTVIKQPADLRQGSR